MLVILDLVTQSATHKKIEELESKLAYSEDRIVGLQETIKRLEEAIRSR